MKITTLIENTVFKTGLIAEHGLSFYIEHNGRPVLFDTGQGNNFIKNALNLGVHLAEINAVIVSHGHYDHAGGLKTFCAEYRDAPIFVKDGFFGQKYRGRERFIGTGYDEAFHDRLHTAEDVTEIVPGVFIVPQIPVVNEWDTHFNGLTIKENGQYRTDEFGDEQFLVIVKDGKMNIISGCSHRGISNIVLSAVKTFNLPINLLLGGFHLKENTPEETGRLIGELSKHQINSIGVCHCTGIERFAQMKETFHDSVFYCSTGNVIEI